MFGVSWKFQEITESFLLISDWCAKIYQHGYKSKKGWVKVVGETSQLDLMGNENNHASSARVRPGCTLKLFQDFNNVGLLDSLTSDFSFQRADKPYNDQVSSLSCSCQGMRQNV